MKNNFIEIEKEKLESLLKINNDLKKENEEMKEIIKNGFSSFNILNEIINFSEISKNGIGSLMLKFPKIYNEIKNNKDNFSFINEEFLNKIKKYGNS